MNHTTMTAAKATQSEFQAKRAKFQDKKQLCESMAADINTKLSGLEQAHSILEKRYLADEASLAQVTASRNEIEAKRAELSEAERLAGLAAEATREIDQQIQQAKQAIAAAQREFCAEQLNAAIAKIKADAAFRKNLIAAMVANVGTGGSYTFSPPVFVEKFVHQLLPQISEAEVREELEKFKKSNGLD